jgi:hypothetical protein
MQFRYEVPKLSREELAAVLPPPLGEMPQSDGFQTLVTAHMYLLLVIAERLEAIAKELEWIANAQAK